MTMTWEHEKTFEAALAQPNHPWRGAALAFEPELRRLREENANLRAMNLSMDGRERLEWTREVGRLREELARVSTRRMQLAAELASTAYVRAKPWTGSYPGELAPLRNPDHADTTQDTTKTRCARNEQETSTSAEDLAGVSRTVAANWDENS